MKLPESKYDRICSNYHSSGFYWSSIRIKMQESRWSKSINLVGTMVNLSDRDRYKLQDYSLKGLYVR